MVQLATSTKLLHYGTSCGRGLRKPKKGRVISRSGRTYWAAVTNYGPMVISGAMAAGRLEETDVPLVTVTTTGTLGELANDAGSLKFMMSHPGISRLGLTRTIESPVMSVVPTVTLTSAGVTPLTPVRVISSTVGTVIPLPSIEVTVKGSPVRAAGLVTFTIAARPPTLKRSGCAGTICRSPRSCVPPFNLLLTTTVATPGKVPGGTTKLICLEIFPTKYSPAAAPFTETETPLSSTGKAGRRSVSEPPLAI